MKYFNVGFLHTNWPPESLPIDEKKNLAWASRHLGADHRNAVKINDSVIHVVGWTDKGFDDKFVVQNPNGRHVVKTRAAAFKLALR